MYMQVKQLISQMTLEEKIAQLNAVPIEDLLDDSGEQLSEEKLEQQLSNGIGQITRVAGGLGDPSEVDTSPKHAAELANDIQKYLKEKTRLGIPAIVHEECLSGFMADGATVFPQAIGLASTWDTEAIEAMTEVIRQQMRAAGAHQGLSPVLDVARDPRWGRVEETFGEDPYLVASMATSYVRGLQGKDLTKGIFATLKHFAGHSFSEGGRNCAPIHVGGRELWDIFLFPFEAAVRETNAKSVMNAYHDIDGVPCAASRELLTDILRGHFGFDGIVVSDYDAIDRLRKAHFTAVDKKEAAVQALEAGIDIELPKMDCYGQPLIDAVKEGMISEATINESVERVLTAKFELGLFDDLYVDVDSVPGLFETPEQRDLSRDIARKSIVLLKNDNVLPLSKDVRSIAVIGPNADNARNMLGDYAFMAHRSYDKTSVHIVTVLEGIKNKVSESCCVTYAKGCDIIGSSTDGFAEAVDAAKAADAAIVVVGDNSGIFGKGTSGENDDRTDITLPGVQMQLIKAIKDTGKPVIVVLINGRAFAVKELADNVSALMEAWYPGEEGGNAVADVLFGDYNPAGRLPVSLPCEVGQIPINYNLKPASYMNYLSTEAKPAFAFGYGMSYTTFGYSDLNIAPAVAPSASKVDISFKVTNAGQLAGDEVVQLYIRDEVSSIVRPIKELKGFKRINLQPGETKEITFTLYADQLAFHDKDMRLVVEPGTFKVMVGSSSDDIRLEGSFEIDGQKREVMAERRFFADVSVQ
jgi:beta-glucosidase